MLPNEIGILVVDDVNTMRVQIKEMLKTFGFKKVLVAASGSEAKLFLETENIQLVLSDWKMEPGDGMDLLKYVRQNPNLQHVSFIMVTAENTKEKVVDVIKAGVDDYLVKPLTPAQIQNKVYAILIRKQVL